MKWTKLKQLVEQRIAPSIRLRFAINRAAYGACSCGHAWITLDKKVIANFCTRTFGNIPRRFDDALSSEYSLVQSLAVIDSRVGKRKLQTIDIDTLHLLAGNLFTERCLAEGLVIKGKIEQETNKLNIEPFNE